MDNLHKFFFFFFFFFYVKTKKNRKLNKLKELYLQIILFQSLRKKFLIISKLNIHRLKINYIKILWKNFNYSQK